MLRQHFKQIAVWVATMIALASCSDNANKWTVEGTVADADGQTMILEANDNGRWYALDSVTLDKSGRFSISHAPAGYPDIYRLRLGNKTLYFPIDSIENLTVVSRAGAFDTEYELEGSESARQLMEVDRRLIQHITKGGALNLANDTTLKRDLGRVILGDRTGVVAYYIINKRIGGVPIFDPTNKSDLRIIGAVANAFNENRPDDPRTAYLNSLYLGNKRMLSGAPAASDTIRTDEIGHFDIKLYDESGHRQSLSELVAKGHPVLLNFTVYQADASPAFNIKLNEIYRRYHASAGLEIYQVSVDNDKVAWREAARALPWITVYNSPETDARNLLNYNVTDIPVFFIINSDGEIVDRINDINALDAALARSL